MWLCKFTKSPNPRECMRRDYKLFTSCHRTNMAMQECESDSRYIYNNQNEINANSLKSRWQKLVYLRCQEHWQPWLCSVLLIFLFLRQTKNLCKKFINGTHKGLPLTKCLIVKPVPDWSFTIFEKNVRNRHDVNDTDVSGIDHPCEQTVKFRTAWFFFQRQT